MGNAGTAEVDRWTIPNLRDAFEHPRFTVRSIVAFALSVGATVFLLSYGIAAAGGFGGAYLRSGPVYFVLLGTIAGLIVLLWGGRYHLTVWETVRPCFEVDDETYAETVEPLLDRAYSARAIALQFLLALVAGIVADLLIGVPVAIAIDTPGRCLFQVAGACFDYLSAVNYLYGLVVLLGVVTAFHAIAQFLRLVMAIGDLPLADPHTAAERLEPIAHFSIFVATSLFGGVLLLTVAYSRLLGVASEVTAGTPLQLAGFIAEHALVVMVVVAGLILLGLVVFWIPQMAIHGLLSAAKQDRLSTIYDGYDRLIEDRRDGGVQPGELSAELEVLDARLRNARDIDTWSYNLPTLLPFVGSAVASAITWFLEFAGKVGL